MNISIWISILISLICLFFVVIYPLFLKKPEILKDENESMSFNREVEIMEKLEELKADYQMGKLDKDEYESMQNSIQRELIR